MQRQPSSGKVLKNDYFILLMILFVVVFWAITLYKTATVGTGSAGTRALGVLTLIGTPIALFFSWRRFNDMLRVLRTGATVKGQVTSLWYQKDRGRIEYTYSFQGKTHQGGSALWKGTLPPSVEEGSEIELVVDPQDPARALVASLFF